MTDDEQTAYDISGLFLFMARMFGPCHSVSVGSVVACS